MATTEQAWREVGDRFSALGLKLKLHFEQTAGDDADLDSLKNALQAFGDTLGRGFNAVEGAVRDDAVREDVRDVGRTLTSALDASFGSVRAELKDCFTAMSKRARNDDTPATE